MTEDELEKEVAILGEMVDKLCDVLDGELDIRDRFNVPMHFRLDSFDGGPGLKERLRAWAKNRVERLSQGPNTNENKT